jgi:predicted metal-dependent peptidase
VKPNDKLEEVLSASRLRMRLYRPFFATLSMFAPFVVNENIPALATDGRKIHVNPSYLDEITHGEIDALLLHEVLHLALLHVPRRGDRDGTRWNIAADIVVNAIVADDAGLPLPEGTIRDPELEHLPVEEIYELLDDDALADLGLVDLIDAPIEAGELGEAERAEIAEFWEDALREAQAVQNASSHGKMPAGMQRHLANLGESRMDWRTLLWRYLVVTPTDFGGYDRRHVWQGLYLETLVHRPATLYVAVDTSGSITRDVLRSFLSEVQGIISIYPHMNIQLYYSDASLHGPYSLSRREPPPPAVGGGGTSFVPFFDAISDERDLDDTACVYLTDGWGTFPEREPDRPVIWVVPAGGRSDDSFPFGEVVRMIGAP